MKKVSILAAVVFSVVGALLIIGGGVLWAAGYAYGAIAAIVVGALCLGRFYWLADRWKKAKAESG